MFNRLDIYVPLIYLLAAVPYVWLGLYAWNRRPAIAVTSFAQVMLGMSIWSSMYALEIFSPSISAKILFTEIEYFGIVVVPVAMLFFALEFTGKSHLLTDRIRLVIWSVPVLILVLVWTNELHHLMWDMESISSSAGLQLLDLRFQPFFWINVIFSYLLLVIASIILIMEMIQRPGIYRVQTSFVILTILFPLIGSYIFVTGGGFIKNLDMTPLFF